MKKQTATKWLEQEFIKLESTSGVTGKMYELIERAKEIDKENIINAHLAGQNSNEDGGETEIEYFNEMFDK